MKSSELSGKQVIGDEGWQIGKIKDLDVDAVTWQVKALDVELFPRVANEFRLKKILRSTRVAIAVENVKSVGDHVVLKISKIELKSILQPTKLEEKTSKAEGSSKIDSLQ